jgi:hypothetical protein
MKQKTRLITKDDILTDLYKSDFIKDLIWTITSGNQLKEDLKSELFLILFEMDDRRILGAYNNNYLHYLCVNILKKQYHSKTSPFHKKFRKEMGNNYDGNVIVIDPCYQSENEWKYNSPLEIEPDTYVFPEELMEKIIWFVDNKLDLVDRELFKIYYKIGRYDRWLGDLRDTNCKKPISSLRKVENKLAITTIEGKKITIGYDTIRLSLNRSLMRIKYYLKENELD